MKKIKDQRQRTIIKENKKIETDRLTAKKNQAAEKKDIIF